MGLISKPNIYTVGATIVASEHNANDDTSYNAINGNLDNANIKDNAGIIDTKLAQIATASKVKGSSLTTLGGTPSGGGTLPAANGGQSSGFVADWAGTVAAIPTGWLICDGAAVNRTTYADLFAVTSTIHGVGNGSTTFNVPDLVDAFVVGAKEDDSGVPKSNITGALLQSGGDTTHTHTGTTGTKAQTSTTSEAGGTGFTGAHNHTISSDSHIPTFYAMVKIIKT